MKVTISKHQKAVNLCNLQPQPPEQRDVYIGLTFPQVFDNYLYVDFGFNFLEGDIPTEDFRENRTDEEIEECVQQLVLMRDSCIRVIGKLERVLLTTHEGFRRIFGQDW